MSWSSSSGSTGQDHSAFFRPAEGSVEDGPFVPVGFSMSADGVNDLQVDWSCSATPQDGANLYEMTASSFFINSGHPDNESQHLQALSSLAFAPQMQASISVAAHAEPNVLPAHTSVPSSTTPELVYYLASTWLGYEKLKRKKLEGLEYKEGRFSRNEKLQILVALCGYQQERGLTPQQLNALIFQQAQEGAELSRFWTQIALSVPMRPRISVYKHVRSQYKKAGGFYADS